MPKRIPISDFEIKLREWQKKKNLVAKEAADFLGVNLGAYRHWLYDGVKPRGSKCRECIERKLNE